MASEPGKGPRLGEVLLQHNVISFENLTAALDEQAQTGRPLGEIVVERGYASPHFVAQALATQYGGMVKTEYGYATGFQARANLAPPVPETPVEATREVTVAELRRLLTQREAELERLQDMINQLRAQVVDAAKAKTRLAEAEAELARLRAATFAA